MNTPNLFDPAFSTNPYAFYQRALAEQRVLFVPDSAVWLVTGDDEIEEICSRPDDFSNDISSLIAGQHHQDPDVAAVIAKGWPQLPVLLMSDPPDHHRFRRLVNKAFSAKRVDAIEHEVRAFSHELVERLPRGEEFDFVSDYAIPLPVNVIASQLGLPREMRDKVRFWSAAFTDQLGGMIDKERALECAQAVVDFQTAMIAEINKRRTGPATDLLADLVQASSDGDAPLSDGELLSIAQQLLVAGNETSTSTVAEGFKLLLTHTDQMALLRHDSSLRKGAVEEILRMANPVAGSWRIVTRDLDFRGHKMTQGSKLMVRFAAASRDPSRFEQPDAFDITRGNVKRHFAFGRGIHTCIGNMLARKEIEVSLEHMLAQFEEIELTLPADQLSYSPSVMLRGLEALPMRCR